MTADIETLESDVTSRSTGTELEMKVNTLTSRIVRQGLIVSSKKNCARGDGRCVIRTETELNVQVWLYS